MEVNFEFCSMKILYLIRKCTQKAIHFLVKYNIHLKNWPFVSNSNV